MCYFKQYFAYQKQQLNQHFYNRALNIMKQTQQVENKNIQACLEKIVLATINEAEKSLTNANVRAKYHESAFLSAVQGLREGNMSFEGDQLLPDIVDNLKTKLEPLKKLSVAEEDKMFALTAEQKKLIAASDKQVTIEYLSQAPDDSSAAVKNTEVYRSIVERMKRRIQTTFNI